LRGVSWNGVLGVDVPEMSRIRGWSSKKNIYWILRGVFYLLDCLSFFVSEPWVPWYCSFQSQRCRLPTLSCFHLTPSSSYRLFFFQFILETGNRTPVVNSDCSSIGEVELKSDPCMCRLATCDRISL
jgi:hypothetical protein